MSDLFEFGRAAGDPTAADRYGSAGEMKKTQYVLQLLGFPGQSDTLKCLITAAEMGMEIDCDVLDILECADEKADYLTISPFGLTPALKEFDYIVAGESGIMSFIEARGIGDRLPPKNAALLAEQNYWSDIACSEVGPHVDAIVKEKIYGQMAGSVRKVNTDAIEAATKALAAPLDALDQQLASNTFVIGNYSFADIHWTAYIHLLYEAGEGDLIDQRPNLKAWFDRIKVHNSYAGQDIVAYELLPTLADIKNKSINSVEIFDY